jgi:hypothetical protein
MKPEKRAKFLEWYEERKMENKPWNLKEERAEYCKDDVKLLSKTVLTFRKLFKDAFDVDPWKYTTLPSLCMCIYRGLFMPHNNIVANENNRESTMLCKRWLVYLNVMNDVLLEHRLECIVSGSRSEGKIGENKSTIFKNGFTNLYADAYNPKTKTVYEFNGCAFHGCQICKAEQKNGNTDIHNYNRTVEKRNILKANGYNVIEIFECEFDKLLKASKDKKEIIDKASNINIKTRDALYGGRTEAFKTYYKCKNNEKIHYLDIVSLYPTVNALDDYATGFRRYRNNTTEEDILNDNFIGLVKCKVYPPKDLYLPVLPCRIDKKLLFQLEPFEGTYTTVELRKALQKGYKIEIISATEYDRTKNLMKGYVQHFLKNKTKYSKNRTQEECDKINEYHKSMGIEMDLRAEECSYNPGLKQMSKLCLCALWGKFAMSCEKEQWEYVSSNAELMQMLCNDK